MTSPVDGGEPGDHIDEEEEVVLSGDGRYVVFSSYADDLFPGQVASVPPQLYRLRPDER